MRQEDFRKYKLLKFEVEVQKMLILLNIVKVVWVKSVGGDYY